MKGSGFATGRRIFPEQIAVTRDTRAPAVCDQEFLSDCEAVKLFNTVSACGGTPVSASYRDRGKDP